MNVKFLTGDWTGRLFLAPVIVIPTLNNLQLGLLILLGAFILDFLTGVLASYMEIKRGDKPMPPSGWVLESNRMRDSIVKAIGYMSIILISLAVENFMFDKTFKITSISDKSFRITELVIGFCISIEIWSTIAENLKRAGFDVLGKIKKAATGVWSLIRNIKGEKDE